LDLFSNKINEKNAAELQVILASSAKTLRGHQTGRIKRSVLAPIPRITYFDIFPIPHLCMKDISNPSIVSLPIFH
jgi:hypothetical protein